MHPGDEPPFDLGFADRLRLDQIMVRLLASNLRLDNLIDRVFNKLVFLRNDPVNVFRKRLCLGPDNS
ncbi:hypothetical protein [uncultured Rhodospira sp.]|uniref:hypothetical protein n=1 Tax=uncultured Rhodospira sp. TaxID=1936189 RepID=UPI00260BB1A7|nr:hypothetical protein [uncultured Rhodospira sp.]